MRKILVIAASVLSLSACTTERIVERAPTPDSTQEKSVIPASKDAELNFLEGLVKTHPEEVSILGKVKAIALGRNMCGTIDEGTTADELVEIANEIGTDPGFIGSVVRESVENFCPENQWFIDASLNG